jgi:hypothetical protein
MGGVPVAGGSGAAGFSPRADEAGYLVCSFERPARAAGLAAPSPCRSRPEATSSSLAVGYSTGVPTPGGVAPQAPGLDIVEAPSPCTA